MYDEANDYTVLVGKTISAVSPLNLGSEAIQVFFTDGTSAVISSGSCHGEGVLGLDYTPTIK